MANETLTPPVVNGEKTRKRKFDPENLWAKCRVCQEPGNCENLIYQKIPIKNQEGKELSGSFKGVYFCSVNCQELFKEI